jgi:hypothetical protein
VRGLHREVDRGAPAHGHPDHDDLGEVEGVEEGADVVDEAVGRARGGGLAVGAGVRGDDSAFGERAELRSPHPVVEAAAVQQHDGIGAGRAVVVGDRLVIRQR